MTTFENCVLYYKPTCPFCAKVTDYLQKRGIEVEMRNTLEPENKSKLITLGGKPQVPCLIIDGEPLYESDDIIAYFQNR